MEYFRNAYQYGWSNTESLQELFKNYSASESRTVTFSLPKLHAYGGANFDKLFQMNTVTKVFRVETRRTEVMSNGTYVTKDVEGTRALIGTYPSGPKEIPAVNNDIYYAVNNVAYIRKIKDAREKDISGASPSNSWKTFYDKLPMLAQVQSQNYETVSINLDALTPQEVEGGRGYRFEITIDANPLSSGAMCEAYGAVYDGWQYTDPILKARFAYTVGTSTCNILDPTLLQIKASFSFKDMTVLSESGPFIAKGVKYSAYELLRKALQTIDTQIIDNSVSSIDEYDYNGNKIDSIKYPIVLASDSRDFDWTSKLKSVSVHETTFEGKNLWEVLLQIGCYLHAVPYLEFYDSTNSPEDKFILKFRQLGGKVTNDNNSRNLTIFNSRNLTEYFTQYDSYVTNLFSPQNVVEEWVVPKTSESSYLVSNDVAELHLSKGITEVLALDVSVKLTDGSWQTASALDNIFEKSIYDILSNDNPYQVYPCKGTSLFYSLGDNKILGLSYVPPAKRVGDLPMALKRIVEILFKGKAISDIKDIKFNDMKFHIKYRTQESARLTQFRPDLEAFMKNSSLEKYPHHEQFYGQQDKIVDSERFTANLFGKLIRIANNVYQRQEYAEFGKEKEAGQLVQIGIDKYYITAVESEFYADAIFQKVTYSKNFNQLAQIVTTPSEPRFYEVSERAKIRREVRLMDFLTISSYNGANGSKPKFLDDSSWKSFIKMLIFNEKNGIQLPNYAWTRFKADKWKYAPEIVDKTFPSSLIQRNGQIVAPALPSDHSDCIVPIVSHPMHDGIIFTWDMEDNFKAGDFVSNYIYYDESDTPNDKAYLSKQPLRYVDIWGRADLFDFKLFNMSLAKEDDLSYHLAQRLPLAKNFNFGEHNVIASLQGSNDMGIALSKDGREEMSFNYQINLLHRVNERTEEDEFITYSNLFGSKTSELRMCLLNGTQTLFDANVNILSDITLADNVEWSVVDGDTNAIELRINQDSIKWLNGGDISQVKSIVLYGLATNGSKEAYITRNVGKQEDATKLNSWWIYPTYNN